VDDKLATKIGEGAARFAVNVTGAAITAGTGSAAAGMALNVDANNRQLHPSEARLIRQHAKDFAQHLNGGAEPSAEQIASAEQRLTGQALRQVDSAWTTRLDNDATASGFLSGLTQGYAPVSGGVGGGVLFDARGTAAFNNHAINATALPQNADLYNRLDSTNTRGIVPNVRGSYVALNDAANDRNIGTLGSPSTQSIFQAGRQLEQRAQTPAEQLSVQSARLGAAEVGFTQRGVPIGSREGDALLGAAGEAAVNGLPGEGNQGVGPRPRVGAPAAIAGAGGEGAQGSPSNTRETTAVPAARSTLDEDLPNVYANQRPPGPPAQPVSEQVSSLVKEHSGQNTTPLTPATAGRALEDAAPPGGSTRVTGAGVQGADVRVFDMNGRPVGNVEIKAVDGFRGFQRYLSESTQGGSSGLTQVTTGDTIAFQVPNGADASSFLARYWGVPGRTTDPAELARLGNTYVVIYDQQGNVLLPKQPVYNPPKKP
jgi:hypothetical protein